jgi:hypothetical protein
VDLNPPPDAERLPLSQNQEFLCLFDTGGDDGPFGRAYNILGAWRVAGTVRTEPLGDALEDLVRRHGALRTTVVRDGDERYQLVGPPTRPQVVVRDCTDVPVQERDRWVEEILIESESGAYSVVEPPLIRAVLARFDDEDSLLVLLAHHSAVDMWSINVLADELANRYAARTGHDVPDLPDVPQYAEYAVWERSQLDSAAVRKSQDYWATKLAGGAITGTRADHPRSAGLPKTTAAYRFRMDAELMGSVAALARATRSTPFMVLLAAYYAYLRETTGVLDAAVPTLIPGRSQTRFQKTVGAFYNFVPLRTDVTGAATLREIIARTRRTCFEAHSHELSFGLIMAAAGPQIMASMGADENAALAFQVLRLPNEMHGQSAGDLSFSWVRRDQSQELTTDIPDGALLDIEIDPAGGDAAGCVWFNVNRFTEATIRELVADYLRVLRETIAAPDAPLAPVITEAAS